jgi:methyl-accepting chemotaxis protein
MNGLRPGLSLLSFGAMSIRAKLIAACGVLALLTAVVGVAGITGLSVITSAFHVVATESLPSVSRLIQADRDMQRAVVAERTLMFVKPGSPAAQEQMRVHTQSLADVAEHWKAYTAFPAPDAERKQWPTFDKARAAWEASSREVVKLLGQDSMDARNDAIEISLNEGAEKFAAARKLLAALGESRMTQSAARAQSEQARVAGARWLVIGVVLGAFILAATLGGVLARVIARPLRETARLLQEIAEGDGDLRRRLEVRSRDEVGELAQWFNTFIDKIVAIVGQTRSSAVQVAGASQQLSHVSAQLSSAVQEQASGLEETAASIEEITGTVKQSADNARQASQLAVASRETAQKGGEVVAAAVSAMTEINAASKRVSDIITTIDEIAFQTNLLALNAAVEAARAGEQGRGFAVVAAEVRNLAQRSAAAAREIKTLIQDSVAKVEAGAELVNRSGHTLGEIVASVKRVGDIIAEIAAAAQEQSTGIEQVNHAVTQMDRTVQANAADTEQMSSTASGLAREAERLQALVARFKLAEDEAPAARPAALRPVPAAAGVARRPAAPPLVPVHAGNGSRHALEDEF